jgi:primosomal protein N'
MSNDLSFRCPVCRARQELADTCRRCNADLRLVARAHRRVAYLLSRKQIARNDGDTLRQQSIEAELKILAPNVYTARDNKY